MIDPPPYQNPPQWIMDLLRWFCADIFLEEIEGDLHELFQDEIELYGLRKARNRFFFTALRYIKPFLASLLIIGLIVGVLAGSYPAFFLSRFRPVLVLKGVFSKAKQGILLRKGLVVFQFIISAFFIIVTITVFRQLHFMRTYDLGFDQEQIVVVPPNVARSLAPHYEALREALLADPKIKDATMSSTVPGQGGGGDLYVEKGANVESSYSLGEIFVEYNPADSLRTE